MLNLNKDFNNLKFELGNIEENKLLLISSIKIMDEYFETKKIETQKKELGKIKDKFKELKSLIYEYKNTKEREINNLVLNQDELKENIENHKKNYETLIDKVTLKLKILLKKIHQALMFNYSGVSKTNIRKKILNIRKKNISILTQKYLYKKNF